MKNNLILILALAAALLFMLQPVYTWFAADDYCYIHDVKIKGVFRSMWNDYLTWDGRSISLTYPLSRLGLYLQKAWVGPLMASMLMAAAAFVMLNISGYELKGRKQWFMGVMLTVALLWLASFNFIGQTLYWTTGTGYNLDVLLLLSAYYVATRFSQSRLSGILSVPLMLYAGTGSPNGVLALLFLLALEMVKRLVSGQGVSASIIRHFLLILTGFAVVLAAPGNANRLTGLNQDNLTHIWTLYFNVKLMFSRLWEYSTPVVWLMLLPALYAAQAEWNQHRQQPLLSRGILWLHAHRFLIAALIMFAFFIPLPSLYAPRTHIYFVTFILLYGLNGVAGMLKSREETGAMFGHFAYVGIFGAFILIAGSQAFDARYVKNQLLIRESKLRDHAGKTLVLGKDDVIRPPGSRKFEDLGTDTSYFINYCVARHFGLRSVRFMPDTAAVRVEKSPRKPTN